MVPCYYCTGLGAQALNVVSTDTTATGWEPVAHYHLVRMKVSNLYLAPSDTQEGLLVASLHSLTRVGVWVPHLTFACMGQKNLWHLSGVEQSLLRLFLSC